MNRVTGTTERLTSDGWTATKGSSQLVDIPKEEWNKFEWKAELDSSFPAGIHIDIYNGSDVWEIEEATIRFEVYDRDSNIPTKDRIYKLTGEARPLSNGFLSAHVDELTERQRFEWSFINIKGQKR